MRRILQFKNWKLLSKEKRKKFMISAEEYSSLSSSEKAEYVCGKLSLDKDRKNKLTFLLDRFKDTGI